MRALVGSTFSVARAHHGFEHGTAVPAYRRSALAKSDSQSDEPTAEGKQCSHAAGHRVAGGGGGVARPCTHSPGNTALRRPTLRSSGPATARPWAAKRRGCILRVAAQGLAAAVRSASTLGRGNRACECSWRCRSRVRQVKCSALRRRRKCVPGSTALTSYGVRGARSVRVQLNSERGQPRVPLCESGAATELMVRPCRLLAATAAYGALYGTRATQFWQGRCSNLAGRRVSQVPRRQVVRARRAGLWSCTYRALRVGPSKTAA
jgi:hypothetical protein